jgi:hypothetical protein
MGEADVGETEGLASETRHGAAELHAERGASEPAQQVRRRRPRQTEPPHAIGLAVEGRHDRLDDGGRHGFGEELERRQRPFHHAARERPARGPDPGAGW